MEDQISSRSRTSSRRQRVFVVAPRSPLGKWVTGMLMLVFAVLALLMFGVIVAGAIVLAALSAAVLMLKPPRPARGRRPGRIIEGEHTVESIEGREGPAQMRRR